MTRRTEPLQIDRINVHEVLVDVVGLERANPRVVPPRSVRDTWRPTTCVIGNSTVAPNATDVRTFGFLKNRTCSLSLS
jgi:hypothetical protein